MGKFFSALVLFIIAMPAWSAGILIPAPQRVDMVHDSKRNVIYISEGNHILRHDVATGAMLTPIVLDGALSGIDISPDNRTLVVADTTGSTTQSWVYLVDLDNLNYQKVVVPTDIYEGGTFTAVYGADNNVYTTSTFLGSGWVSLRRLNTANNTWTNVASVTQNTMLSASGDGDTIAFAESNISDGRWGLLDIPTGVVVRREWYENGTSWFNYEIATDRFGAQFSIPVYGGGFVYNDVYQKIATLGQYAGPQPIGVAYHPVERIAYFPWVNTQEVYVYDMNSLTKTGSYDVQYTFSNNGNYAFQNGRTKLSRDGSLLMTTVGGGIRAIRMYSPLAAASLTVATRAGVPLNIPLSGSIGNGGSLSYALASQPAHGSASIVGNSVTYIAAAGFHGTDTFRYRVMYGRAISEATITVEVTSPNRAPVAVNDEANVWIAPISIPVLANDSDPDGDELTIVSVTQPNVGRVKIQGRKVMFIPVPGLSTATFTYTVSDGRGATDTGVVNVSRTRWLPSLPKVPTK